MAKLWIWWGLVWAQPVLPLSRLVYYSDGRAYWQRETVLPLRSPLVVKIPGRSRPILLPQPEYNVRSWSVAPDTILQRSTSEPPGSVAEFLRRSIGATVWIAYPAGNEWEELQGTVEYVNTRGDLLLRKSTGEQVLLPGKLIRVARLVGSSPYVESRPGWRLMLHADTALPAARVAVAGWDTLPPWQARHTLQILGPTRVGLFTQIALPPFPESAYPLELYLIQGRGDSLPNATWHLPLQRIEAGYAAVLTLLRTEMPYTDVYRASLPDLVEALDPFSLRQWQGTAQRTLQILNTEKIPLPSGTVQLLDEQGLPLAESTLPFTAPNSIGYIPLSPTTPIQLRLQESELRREKSKDPLQGPKVTLLGSLRVQNGSSREVRLLIEKPITGQPLPEKLGFARATPLDERRGSNLRYLLQWELLLRPGATEVLEYAYELTLPVTGR